MSSEVLTHSWSNEEELDVIYRAWRNNEILKGVVRSVGFKDFRVLENGSYIKKRVEILSFVLEEGIIAYCPAHEFSEHQYNSLTGFVGTIQEFIIENVDLEEGIALVSVRKADEIKKQRFWDELESLQEKGQLSDKIFDGTISGFNPETERIFVRVNGVDCFMLKYDWDYGRIRNIQEQIERGATIKVKVLRFDKERQLVQVSRKDTFEDPFNKLEELKEQEAIAGKVTAVDTRHGIFVQLDVGLEVKGMKPRHLPEPVVGDIVTCRVREIDRKNRRCKVVIIGYPRGKKTRKDIGAFLFE